jgi:hypothetical protein
MAKLQQELATYESKLPELRRDGGKFVLIKQDGVEGIYETYADALNAGYERFKLDQFLVKQIPPTKKPHPSPEELQTP